MLKISQRLKSTRSDFFRVVEVGPRDGLQAEKNFVPTDVKIELIDRLSTCGYKTIEITSFVSPKWVPQMADHNEIVKGITRKAGISYPVLVPNSAGLKNAFRDSRKNTNCTIDEGLKKLTEVTKTAIEQGIRVRGYVSCIVGCPYEGKIDPNLVAKVTDGLLEAGCYEVSLGDTIGVGTAGSVSKMLDVVLKTAPAERLAVHFHDTYGQALANVLLSIEKGIRAGDSSLSGLGGCPYAKGATGNLATEDLLYFLNGVGLDTGISLDKVIDVAAWFNEKTGRTRTSRVASAFLSKRK